MSKVLIIVCALLLCALFAMSATQPTIAGAKATPAPRTTNDPCIPANNCGNGDHGKGVPTVGSEHANCHAQQGEVDPQCKPTAVPNTPAPLPTHVPTSVPTAVPNTPIATSVPPTHLPTVVPTNVPNTATPLPQPTNTPVAPTNTPASTSTPLPNTPVATSTAIPPTATPKPVDSSVTIVPTHVPTIPVVINTPVATSTAIPEATPIVCTKDSSIRIVYVGYLPTHYVDTSISYAPPTGPEFIPETGGKVEVVTRMPWYDGLLYALMGFGLCMVLRGIARKVGK
jgi:hypothetical protein